MSQDETANVEASENEQIVQRRAKLAALRQEQEVAFPNDFKRSDLALDLHANYGNHEHDWFLTNDVPVKVAGRIMTRRVMGKASFITIKDMSGSIQIYLRRDDLPEGRYAEFKTYDLGDIVGVEGKVFKTKTGELSVKASELRLLAKSLHPLPEKFHGLTDLEVRSRQRYLDLMVNDKSREIFLMRSALLKEMRRFFDAHGFVEVETPMMQPIPGGAAAKPFVTHHNTLDMTLYLRIAPELYLKRLVVGGIEKVYEINRNFRNEGISTRHNPEFTMIEFYWAYADYNDLIDFTEKMLAYLAQTVLGSTKFKYQDQDYDFAKPFTRLSLADSLLKFNADLSKEDLRDVAKLSAYAEKLGIEVRDSYGLGKIQYELFEKTVEKNLFEPTFITEYPAEVSPLARRNDKDPFIVDRFELFIGGRELSNGFSELNDPEDQAARFKKQAEEHAAGDEEAMRYDQDYITALEYGLPPTAGEGMGIDRLAMLFTDSDCIRDVILFPLLKPQID